MARKAESELEQVLREMPFTGGTGVTILDHPDVRGWLAELAELRKTRGYSYAYISKVVRALAEKNGLTTRGISETSVRRYCSGIGR